MVSKKDMKILEMLQEDSRIPMTQIAKAVGMSENGVRYRLDKMEQEGVIRRYTVLLEPKKVGKKVMAAFDIEVEPKKIKESIELMKNMDEIIKIYQTTGQYSILAIGLFENNEVLNEFVNNKFLKNVPVLNYSVNIVTKKFKDSIYLV
jgi:Lrp/AsnC family transcriptional regulator for asnA, asnC and gidA